MDGNLLDLVRQYGIQEREDAGSTRDPMSKKATGLFDRIAALVQQDADQHRGFLALERRLEAVEQRLAGVIENHHLWDGS